MGLAVADGKVERARRMVTEATIERDRLARLRAELPVYACAVCGGPMFQYQPPLTYQLQKCRLCRSWNEIGVERPTAP